MDFIDYLSNKKIISNADNKSIKAVLSTHYESLDKIIQSFDEYISEYLKNQPSQLTQTTNADHSTVKFDHSKIKEVVSKKDWLDLIDQLNNHISTPNASPEQTKSLISELSMFTKRLNILSGELPQIEIIVAKISSLLEKVKQGESAQLIWIQTKECLELANLFFEDLQNEVTPSAAWENVKVGF